MREIIQELRHSLRSLLKSPGFALTCVLTLGLGIGANTAIFSLLDQILLRRLPVERPEELVILRSPGPLRGHASSDGDIATSFSYPMYKRLREKNEVFAGMLARYAIPLSVSTRGQTERANGELVTGDYFETLGVKPALGRLFNLSDEQTPGGHPMAVLSHGYWSRRFAQDPAILNQNILVNGHSLTVVGVARAGFNGVQAGQRPDIFIPLMMKAQMTPNWDGLQRWDDYWMAVIGRLKPGISAQQAEAGILPVYRAALEDQVLSMSDWPKERRDRFVDKKILLVPGAQGRLVLQNDVGSSLYILFGMVALVLLIACTNVANLLLVRGLGKRRELAIRLALGSGRWRLIRQILIESLILAIAGGAAGLLLATWINEILVRAVSASGRIEGLSAGLDGRVLGFTLAVSILTGVLFGLLPAWRATRDDLTPALKDQSTSASLGHAQARLRKVLVGAQVALTMLLLVGAGLLTRTLLNLRNIDLGLKTEQLITFSVAPELNSYSPEKTAIFANQLSDALNAVPGVQGASAATVAVLTDNSEGSNITVEGGPQEDDRHVNRNRVGPGYFSVMGIPLLSGREFTKADTAKSQKVAIINDSAAKKLFSGRNPIGMKLIFGGGKVQPDIEIVGVVKDMRYANVREDAPMFVYQPYTQDEALGQLTYYVRTSQDALSIVPSLRQAVQRLDANLPIYDIKTVETVVNENLFGERILAFLSICFGGLAALLAGVGLYGVLAYWVVQRSHEIGIRIALGAAPGRIRQLILSQGLKLTLAGVVAGLIAALASGRLLSGLLYGVKAIDPLTFIYAGLLLGAISFLACYLPARRATKVDPIKALRNE